MKAKFLSNRLKSLFLPNSNQSYFEYLKRNPEKVDGLLSKLIIFDKDTVKVTGSAWRFDYESYIKSKGYKIVRERGFDCGPVYDIEKV